MLKALKLVALNVIAFVLIFALLEGLASLAFTAVRLRRATGVAEQFHSTHDPTIGWVNLPNVSLPDLYGPGISLRTNAQAFRNDRDTPREVPAGTTRIMCSGDSFTLGYGVSNHETWCHRLSTLAPGLETVNLGQGGYGLDQAYLWYKRAGAAVDHQVHLMAFITGDFDRMQFDNFVGYAKPLLGLRGDSLAVLNLPVPNASPIGRWWLAKGYVIQNLDIVRLASKLRRESPPSVDSTEAKNATTRKVAARIFEDLARVNRSKNSRLVLVLLPGANDYRVDNPPPSWRSFVTEEAARQGIQLIDLFDDIRRLPPTEVDALFLQDGHYSVKGNDFVARAVYSELNLAPSATK